MITRFTDVDQTLYSSLFEEAEDILCGFRQALEYEAGITTYYKKLYTHSIEFVDEKFNIQMVANEIGIPETGRQKQCALIGVSGMNDEFHLRLLDKDAEKAELESKFITEFLNAEKVDDDKMIKSEKKLISELLKHNIFI